MRRLLKENLALTVGIALPVILTGLFFLAGRAAVATVDPPAYDAVFAVNYAETWPNQPWRLRVEDGDLVVTFAPPEGLDPRGYVEPQLYVFDHQTFAATPLTVDFRNVVDGVVQDPELDALNRKRLLRGPQSPDGYRFEYDYRSGSGLVGELLGFARSRNAYTVKKGARTIVVEGTPRFYQAHFIAWIEE